MLARVLALALVTASSVPATAAPMQPTGKWVVNFDDQQCLAYRDYGTPAEPFRLIFKQPALGSVMQVAVQTKGSFTGRPDQVSGALTFDNQAPLKIPALQWRPEGSKLVFRMINVPLNDFAAVRTAQTMRVDAGMLHKELALSSVASLLKVMDTCVADLRRVWNVGSHSEGSPVRVSRLAGLFRSEDYPSTALRDNQSGMVTVVVLVDERGAVADCSVVETSGIAVLDSQACAVIRERGRFEPARDASGKARKDAFIQRVGWSVETR